MIHVLVLPFLNNPNDLELSFKTDLDFWDCFGREKKKGLITEEIGYQEIDTCHLFMHK